MCETFVFYHLCGHIHSKKVWKCSKAVERHLELAAINDNVEKKSTKPTKPVKAKNSRSSKSQPSLTIQTTFNSSSIYPGRRSRSSSPTSPTRLCASEEKTRERFIKPNLCTKCAETGVISDWLAQDPIMRFNLVKEWSGHKRTTKREALVLSPETEEASRPRSVEPRTPSPRIQPLDVDITKSYDLEERGVKQMSPIYADYAARAELVEVSIDKMKTKSELQCGVFCFRAKHLAAASTDLRTRMEEVRSKLEALIAENKRRTPARQGA